MKNLKKVCYAIIGVVSILGLCFVAICFLYPDLVGNNTGSGSLDSEALQNAHEALEGTAIESSDRIDVAAGSNQGSASAANGGEATASSSNQESGAAAASSEATVSNSSQESSSASSQESSSATESSAGSSQESSSAATSGAASASSSSQESSTATASSETTSSSEASSTSSSQESSSAAESSEATSGSSQGSGSATSSSEAASGSSQESSSTSSQETGTGAASSQEIIVDGHKDQHAPVFLAFTSSPQIKVGSTFNIHKYIGYADDVDRNVDMEVKGTVDTSKEGTYSITITLRDDAGHKTSKDMKVQVVTKTSSSGGSSKKEAFSDFVKNYKTDNTSVGIDVSRWQETIDFDKVKAAGCEFVYMRLGGYDNGELYTDRYFKQNIAGAKAAGLKIGIYWHSEESTPEEVKASINYMMDVLNGEKLDFPIAFDWEDFMNFENYNMNLYDINHIFDVFVQEIESHEGYTACMYGSKNKLETLWTLDPERAVWLAHYTSATSYTGKYFMWQHSCTGRIDGINGDVDLDVYYH